MGHVIFSSSPSPPTHIPALCYLLDPKDLVEFVTSATCGGQVKKREGGRVRAQRKEGIPPPLLKIP